MAQLHALLVLAIVWGRHAGNLEPEQYQTAGGNMPGAGDWHRVISENVRWRGFLSGKDFWGALLAADVFVLSSVDDPFPLSVGQALHLGKPCIVYRESGFAEVIEKNHWGEVYDIYDEEELYRKIRKVMDNLAGYVIDVEEVKSLLSVKAFAGRLIDAVGTMPTSPCSR